MKTTLQWILISSAPLVIDQINIAEYHAGSLPPTDLPYAFYRKKMLEYGWKPDFAGCVTGPYPEFCAGNTIGTGTWRHPVDGRKVFINNWRCMHGWCIAPDAEWAEN